MAKYCKTYNIICTCVTCENVECGYSPRTKAEAEIARGVKLDKYGNELGAGAEEKQRIPAPVFVEEDAAEAAHTSRREWALFAATALLVVMIAGMIVLVLRPDDLPENRGVVLVQDESAEDFGGEQIEEAEPLIPDVVERTVPPEPAPQLIPEPEPAPKAEPKPAVADASPKVPGWEIERRRIEEEVFVMKEEGNQYVERRNFEKAREIYREAIEKKPDFYQGYNNLANTFSDEGRHGEAQPIYERGLRYSPNSTHLLFNIANTSFRAGQYGKSLVEMERVLALDPNDSEGHLIAGICAYKLGLYEQARVHFADVIDLEPNNAEAYYNLSLAYRQMGHASAARTFFDEAIRINPRIRDASYREQRRTTPGG